MQPLLAAFPFRPSSSTPLFQKGSFLLGSNPLASSRNPCRLLSGRGSFSRHVFLWAFFAVVRGFSGGEETGESAPGTWASSREGVLSAYGKKGKPRPKFRFFLGAGLGHFQLVSQEARAFFPLSSPAPIATIKYSLLPSPEPLYRYSRGENEQFS